MENNTNAVLAERTVMPYSKWKHRKGGHYLVVGVGCGCGNQIEGKSLVVYTDLQTRRLWIRSIEQFLDGRFEPE